MAVCKLCGKKGFFLKLGQHGLCRDCEIKLLVIPDRIRLINESIDIVSQSNNAETALSRIQFQKMQVDEISQIAAGKIDPLLLLGYDCSLSEIADNIYRLCSDTEEWIDTIFNLIKEQLEGNGPMPLKDIISFFEKNPDYWIEKYDISKSIRSLLEQRGELYEISKEKIKNKYYYYMDGQEEMIEQIQNGIKPYKVSPNAFQFQISSEILNLIWIKNGEFQNIEDCNEPSAIDLTASVDSAVSEEDFKEDLGYYPNYESLSPKQKYIYCKWLEDTTQPIPIGYVFIFYYGLERYLLTPKYMMAVDKIIELMIQFDNSSFRSYATDALLIASALNKDPDIISKIPFWENMPVSAYFYFKAQLYHEFSSDDLIKNCRFWGFTNKRYINNEPHLFKQELEKILTEKYHSAFYPVDPQDLKKSTSKIYLSLANYSLSKRTASIPDLSGNVKIASEIKEILQAAHESVKVILRKQRSSQKNTAQDSLPVLTTDD